MIESINGIKLYRTKYTGNVAELREALLPKLEKVFQVKITGEYGGPVVNGICSFFNDDESGKNLQTWPELQDLIKFLNHHIKLFTKELGISNYNLEWNGMWANKYPRGSYAHVHWHTDDRTSPLYGILFYLRIPEDSGNFVVQIPNKDDKLEDYELVLHEGDVNIIPLYLPHYTHPNNNDEAKLIIGTEVFIKPVE